jgi:hypothetical protein
MMPMRSMRYFITFLLLAAVLCLTLGCGGGGGTTYTVTSNAPSVGAPSSISAMAGNGSVTVSWSSVSGVTSYNLYCSTSTPVSHATATKHSVSGTTFVDTGLTNGVRYYYVMTSVKLGVESPDSSEVSAVPGSTGTISGKVRYEDKELTGNPAQLTGGFTGNTKMKAVRYATIEVVNAANSSVLYTTQTNSLGMYSILTSTGSTTVYVRVDSIATPPTSASITVTNLSSAKYAVPSQNISLAGSANVNISIPTTNTAGGAFSILDVMTTGYDFINHLNGAYPAVPLNAYWAPGNLNGTYFCYGGCPVGDGIYVLSQTGGDTDEYDDDVLWHEFGHFIAHNYSLDDSPGGQHSLGDNELDLRLSWSEGWGDFFPGAIKTWLSASGQSNLISSAAGISLTTYVDTSGSDGFSFDFGNPSLNGSYSTSEVAIAKLLTDLQATYTMNNVWNVVTNFKLVIPTDPVNLELFWDRWLSILGSGGLPTLNSLYSARSIVYQTDPWEPDDTYLSASTYTAVQNRTLYSSPGITDKDYVQISAIAGTTYTITTNSLFNGADTFLTLYSSTGVTVLTSDDNKNGTNIIYTPCSIDMSCDNGFPMNNTTNLSSKITFTPASNGTYYVEVKSSPGRPTSAGRYGSYALIITHSP